MKRLVLLLVGIAFASVILTIPYLGRWLQGWPQRGLIGLVQFFGTLFAYLIISVGCATGLVWAGRRQYIRAELSERDLAQALPAQADLMRAFDFASAELAANRSGRLSERQQANLSAGRSAAVIIAMIAVVVILGGFAYAAFGIPGLTGVNRPSAESLPGLLIGGGVVTVLVSGSIAYSMRTMRGHFNRRIRMVEGIVEQENENTQTGVRTVQIGRTAVPIIDERQQAALPPGLRVRVYYLEGRLNTVLSLESLERAGSGVAGPGTSERAS